MSKPFEEIPQGAFTVQDEPVAAAWEEEILAPIRVLDNGTADSDSYEDVMRSSVGPGS